MDTLNLSRKAIVFGLIVLAAFLVGPTQTVKEAQAAPSLAFTDCASQAYIPETECDALVALYNSTAGAGWTNSAGWLSADNPCTWYGVICSAGQVISLSMSSNNVVGTIPVQLGNLTNLQWLSLQNNQLSGGIPTEISNLTNLRSLNLTNNQLSGSIPVELGNLSSLQFLVLRGNQLSGSIPAQLGDLSSLQELTLNDNQLSGSIPVEVGNLAALHALSLSNNLLSGSIPSQLGNLSSLQYIWLENNQLSGIIPVELGDLANLVELYLNNNQLSGGIPTELGNLTSLSRLLLRDNPNLTGALPTSLTNLTALEYLRYENTGLCEPQEAAFQAWLTAIPNRTGTGVACGFSGCSVQGFIPAVECDALVALYNTTAGSAWTDRTGWLSADDPCTWTGVTCDAGHVNLLNFYSNNLVGAIPAQLEDLNSLQRLDLGFNQLSGSIPVELGNLPNLQFLLLNANQLNGGIPVELGGLSNLEDLYLSNNQLSGSIPVELGTLSSLQSLALSANQLSGSIPVELGTLSSLQSLSLAGNQLTGGIPVEFGNLTSLQKLNLTSNPLGGSIPVELGGLSNLERLNLGNNQLSGNIPSELGNLTSLQSLHLYNNQLNGNFPSELGNLINLIYLDFSNNINLTGSLPASLTNLTGLDWFYYDNTGLCEPQDAPFQAWLTAIPNRTGTGVACPDPVETFTNTSFETEIPTDWVFGKNTEVVDGRDCTEFKTGSCGWALNGNDVEKRIVYHYRPDGLAGDSFDFSVWRKAVNTDGTGYMVAEVLILHQDLSKDKEIIYLAPGDQSVWEQKTASFAATEDYQLIVVSVVYKKPAGTMWVDDISLVKNSTTELFSNASFETVIPTDWAFGKNTEVVDGRDCTELHSGSCGWALNGNDVEKRIVYHYRPDGLAGDNFDFSVWRKAVDTGGTGYLVAEVLIIHQDLSKEKYIIYLAPGDQSLWQQKTASFTATEDYQLIVVSVVYKKPAGTMWVDDISLMKGP